jgi:hypothetical protein
MSKRLPMSKTFANPFTLRSGRNDYPCGSGSSSLSHCLDGCKACESGQVALDLACDRYTPVFGCSRSIRGRAANYKNAYSL